VCQRAYGHRALCANYVSINIYEEIKQNPETSDIEQVKTRVGLADNATILQSDKTIRLNLLIHSRDGSRQPFSGKFLVIPMRDNELIIGLPAIISTLWPFFKRALEHAVTDSAPPARVYDDEEELTFVRTLSELIRPWKHDNLEEAPEDLSTPLPVQFEGIASFLGKSREERLLLSTTAYLSRISQMR
jgi:hypothetical protein